MPTTRTRTPRRRKSSTLSTRPRPLAIGYIRVSTAEQADTGASMDAQRAALTIEAARRGWDLEIVPEPGLSAKNMKRPALTAALHRLDDGDADVLLATALDRVSRSVYDVAGLMRRSVDEDWLLVTLRDNIDTGTAMGRAFVQIAAVFAELERGLISERVKAGMAQKTEDGARFGRPRELPDELRDWIAAQFKAGVTASQIARDLNAAGVPTAHGGARWHPGTVRQIALTAHLPAPNGTPAPTADADGQQAAA